MSNLDRLKAGIAAADAAGNHEDVMILGAEYRRLTAQGQPMANATPPQSPPPSMGPMWQEAKRRGLHPEIPGQSDSTGDAWAKQLLDANPERKDPSLMDRLTELAESGTDAAMAMPAVGITTGVLNKLPMVAKYAPKTAKVLKEMTPNTWKGLLEAMGISAASGVTGSVAGQLTSGVTDSPTARRAAELAAPFAGYGATKALAKAGAAFMPGSANRTAEALIRTLANQGEGRIYPSMQVKGLKQASEKLRGEGETDVSAQDVHDILTKHSENIVAKAKKDADAVRATMPAQAEAIERKAAAHAADLERHFRPAIDRLAARADSAKHGAEKVKSEADDARLRFLGHDKEPHQIGGSARDEINDNKKSLELVRENQVAPDKLHWTTLARSQETGGNFIDETQEMKSIISDMKNELVGTGAGVSAIDKSEREGLESIYKSLTIKGRATAEGVDKLMRRLGEEAAGVPQKGFGAIGQRRAKYWHDRMGLAMEEFTPGFKTYQENYAENSKPLYSFMGTLGKGATGKEAYDFSRYSRDASRLPEKLFASRQSVSDFREMIGGNQQAIDDYAIQHASYELRGKNAAAAKGWLNKAKDWMVELSPETRGRIEGYVAHLDKLETAAKRLKLTSKSSGTALESLKKESTGMLNSESSLAREMRDKVMTGTEAKANNIVADAVKEASQIVGSTTPVDKVKSLLLSDSAPTHIKKVVSAIASQPNGKDTLMKATRHILSEVAPGKVGEVFSRRALPALRASGIYSEKELADLKGLVDTVDVVANADVVSSAEVSKAIGDKMRAVIRQSAGGAFILGALGISFSHGVTTELMEMAGAASFGTVRYFRYNQMLNSFVHDIIADPELAKIAIGKPTPENISILKNAIKAGMSGLVGAEAGRVQEKYRRKVNDGS